MRIVNPGMVNIFDNPLKILEWFKIRENDLGFRELRLLVPTEKKDHSIILIEIRLTERERDADTHTHTHLQKLLIFHHFLKDSESNSFIK